MVHDQPMVSVAILSYNHAPFIRQAIESVLAQKHEFSFEIVISDDCSPDGTGKIIDEYQARHPDLFVRKDPPANVGMMANLERVWSACRGKYIAFLEGDDWWHVQDKLAVQIAFMEAHPEFTLCGHGVRWVRRNGDDEREIPCELARRPLRGTIQDLIEGNYIQTCSVVFRNGIVPKIPQWLSGLAMGDWPLFLLHAVHGPIAMLEQTMATYRLHGGGTWSAQTVMKRHKSCLHALRIMRANFPIEYSSYFTRTLLLLEALMIHILTDNGQFGEARQALGRFLGANPSLDREIRRGLHWHFMKASNKWDSLSIQRWQWLNLAYIADPASFDLLALPGVIAGRIYQRICGKLGIAKVGK